MLDYGRPSFITILFGKIDTKIVKKIGYYSSFTHNGKWYTLQDIPEFDTNGL